MAELRSSLLSGRNTVIERMNHTGEWTGPQVHG